MTAERAGVLQRDETFNCLATTFIP